MVHALSEGALEIIPVAAVEEAFQRMRGIPSGTTLVNILTENNSLREVDLNG
jgi:hypothetical protein